MTPNEKTMNRISKWDVAKSTKNKQGVLESIFILFICLEKCVVSTLMRFGKSLFFSLLFSWGGLLFYGSGLNNVVGVRGSIRSVVVVVRSGVAQSFIFGRCFDGFDFVFRSLQGDGGGSQRSAIVRKSVRSGDDGWCRSGDWSWGSNGDRSMCVGDGRSVVRNGYWSCNVFDDRSDSSVSVSFLHRVGEVASKTVRFNDGAVVGRSTDQSRSRDETTLASHQTDEQNGQLQKK